jgi:hypothetical protein
MCRPEKAGNVGREQMLAEFGEEYFKYAAIASAFISYFGSK